MAVESDPDDSCIKVSIRCRPFLPFEQSSKASCVTFLSPKSIKIEPPIHNSLDSHRHTYTFDNVFSGTTAQNEIYIRSVRPLVDACLEGYNATIFAYGQTGSGKTHTMLGTMDAASDICSKMNPEEDGSEAGLIPRAISSLFARLDDLKQETRLDDERDFTYSVSVQFLELYGESIRDLLHPECKEGLKIRDSSEEPEVLNAKTELVRDAQEALMQFTRGMLRRVTRATSMNQSSSRSHAIMSVMVEQCMKTATLNPADNQAVIQTITKRSKFHFVDLAGSERMKRTNHASEEGVKEGININKGLLVLGNVISALANQKNGSGSDHHIDSSFVPYRDSKLTRLLRGSLGGNHKSLMIACISPCSSNQHESLNTLRYANRAKNIKNRAVVNMDAGSKIITALRENLKLIAKEFLRARKLVPKDVVLDPEGTIFTHDVLVALANGENVDLDIPSVSPSTPRKNSTLPFPLEKTSNAGSPLSVADLDRLNSRSNGTSNHSRSMTTPKQKMTRFDQLRSSISRASSSQSMDVSLIESSIVKDASSDVLIMELDKAKLEIKKLKRALEKADDRVIDTQRQLEWTEDELKAARDEIMALADMDNKNTEDESDDENDELDASNFNMPVLNQETYEMVKDIYEEKLMQMTFAIQDCEEDRDNIAMQLHRHETDSSRLMYMKNMLSEDLKKKEEEIVRLKKELKEMSEASRNGNQTSVRPTLSRETSQSRSIKLPIAGGVTSNYYLEKLDSLEKHLSIRESECSNLCKEVEKIQADSVLFDEITKDLETRLRIKNDEIKAMEKTKKTLKTVDAVKKMNSVMARDLEERSQLIAEFDRVKVDRDTLSTLLDALIEEKNAKISQVEKYRETYSELVEKAGLSQEDLRKRHENDDDESVTSATSSFSPLNLFSSSRSLGRNSTSATVLSKKEFDSKISNLEARINTAEDERLLLYNELKKIESDALAFGELSGALQMKLKRKEQQVSEFKTKFQELEATLHKQEVELEKLALGGNGIVAEEVELGTVVTNHDDSIDLR
jgi:kinesin family member 21